MITEFERLSLLRDVCKGFTLSLHTEVNELLSEVWISTRLLNDPALIRLKARSTLIDYYRKAFRRFMPELSESLLLTIETPEGPISSFSLEVADLVDRARLTEEERELLFEYFYQGKTQKEISQTLGLSRVRISQKLTEILKKLKETQKC